MKKIRNIIALLIALAAGSVYAADAYLDIDLIGMVIPDTTKPVIDASSVKTSVTLNGEVDLSGITCEDNRDSDCVVTVLGTIDTSLLQEQSVTLEATDRAGNKETVILKITVIEGIDTTMYVPNGYYDGIDGLSGEPLKNALNDIISGHTEFPYTSTNTDVWDLLREADEDNADEDSVIMFYSAFSWYKACQDTRADLLPEYCVEMVDGEEKDLEWNREHIWSKSHGEFEHEDGSSSLAYGAHTDGHHLVAAERGMNSTKNNRFFDDCHDGINDSNLVDRDFGNYTCGEWYFEPRDEVKGDVARMLFYMATRYEGEDGDYVDLELTTDLYLYENAGTSIKNSKLPYYENLEVLLRWHIEDPVDEWELERNEAIYQFQGNRNPFIDHPELVSLIWGTPENPIEYESTTTE